MVVSSFQCQIWYNSSFISVLALMSIYIYMKVSLSSALSLFLCVSIVELLSLALFVSIYYLHLYLIH